MEYEVYIFVVTANNQEGESMIGATTMIRTDQARELLLYISYIQM